jgi:phosphatidate cytidylyltransferase
MIWLTWMNRPQDALVCLGAGFVLAAMSFLFRWDVVVEEEEKAFSSCGIFLAGLAYIPLLLLPATYLSNVKLVFVLAAVAISDTAAYYVGTRFGHHKLWPRVSPKKSSEGAVGSLVACVIFCAAYGAAFGKLGPVPFALLGIAVNGFAQLGDLFESALKRSVNVKDSGNILPGHGGMLDRADSLLFAMPMVAVVDQWFFFF